MEFGICLTSILPVRREPEHRSEMVNQLLFGELYRVFESNNDWHRIEMSYDNYEGWIPASQHTMLEETEFIHLAGADTPCTMDLVQLMSNETKKSVFPVVLGSSLPNLEEFRMTIRNDVFFYDGQISDTSMLEELETHQDKLEFKQRIISDAMFYLHAPYLWGGRSPFGIDCSGFVQMVYKMNQIKLLRDASQQATMGDVIGMISESEPADLAFFGDEEGQVNHVGIMIDKDRIIHASGKVRIDLIDHEGIYNEGLQKYTHRLRVIKRLI